MYRHRLWNVAGWLVLGLAAVVVSGSARAADEAPKSPQEALVLYSDAASFQNNGAFELAAEEWEKFLKRFPKDALAGKAQHYLGVCHLQLKRYDKAADAFQAVVKKFPAFDGIQDAYLNLGWCQYTLAGQKVEGMYAKAAATFSEMVKKFPDGKHADQAFFFLAESQYHLGRKKEAAVAYEKVVKDHAKSTVRADALYALGVTQEELGQFAEAGKAYDLFLAEFKQSELVTEVRMRKAETTLQAGEHAAAADMFAAVAAVAGFASADHALYRQAFCLAKLEKYAEAGAVYGKLAANFKQSQYAAEAALSAGRYLYRADKADDAAKWLQTVVDAGGENAVEAAHWLCRIYLKQQQPQKASQLAEKVLPKAAKSAFVVNLKLDRADALWETDATKPQALTLYEKLVTEHPDHELAAQALYNAAFGLLDLKKYPEALKRAADFLDKYPEDKLATDVKYIVAESQLQLNQYAEAEKAYRELIASAKDRPEREPWQVRLGLAVYLQKKYAEVIQLLGPALPTIKKPDSVAEAQFLIGASQFAQDNFDPAAAALRASLQANPKWRQADETLLVLSRVLRKQDKTAEAVKTIAQLLQEFPQSRLADQAHYRYGEYSALVGDLKTAIEQYDAVLAASPESTFAPYAMYGKGLAQLRNKAYAEAAASLTALITKHPKHALIPDALLARATSRRQAGEHEGAIEDLDAFLKSKPETANKCEALYERGLAEVALKRFSEAAATFNALLKENPKYANADKALYELAWAYKSQQDDKAKAGALATFRQLATDCPDSPLAAEANFHVGEAHYDQRQYADALKAYTVARDKAAKGDLAEKTTYKLGWANYQLKQYEAALEQFTAQTKDYPQGTLAADGLFMKAECLFRLERYADALPAYAAAQKTQLASPVAQVLVLLHGGQSAAQVKKWDQALALLAQIPEKYPESPYLAEAHYELGWAKQNSGKSDEATADYEKAASLSRAEVGARARFMIGEQLFQKKEYAEAIRQFQRVMFGFGGDAALPEVKPWQAKAGFEAGRCVDVQIQDASPANRGALVAEAVRYYRYVADKHPEEKLAAQAKKRLQELSKL
jgi:TolA-binding protein